MEIIQELHIRIRFIIRSNCNFLIDVVNSLLNLQSFLKG